MILTKLLNFNQRLANWKVMGVIIVLFLFIEAFLLPIGSRKLNEYSHGLGVIDLHLTYSVNKVYQMIESYGSDGRAFYIEFTLSADLIYPLVYSSLFSLLITVIFRKAFALDSWLQKLPLLVYITLIFDYLENICILTMLANYPTKMTILAQFSNVFTICKWSFALISIILLAAGLISLIKRRRLSAVKY
jgi:hypothetical protein